MKFTILGGDGFIGGHLARHLQARGHAVTVASRDAGELAGTHAGHVVYCIGVTSDFRSRPFDTVNAHVCTLARIMQALAFDSWLTLSSTRVYGGLDSSALASEDLAMTLRPGPDSLYDGSKLLGEALTLAHPSSAARVVRLSNVCGDGQDRSTFLASVLDEVIRDNHVVLREDPASTKDYVDLYDVLPMIEEIATGGRHRLYNVASGNNTTHAALARLLTDRLGARVEFSPDAPRRAFARINISRTADEFGFMPTPFSDTLDRMIVRLGRATNSRT